MRIRGCSKPECRLCVLCNINTKENKFFCTKKNADTDMKASCADFRYDIFKYTPAIKADLGKFSKEDFEI